MKDIDKLYNCKHNNYNYCKKIKHELENGYAIKYHCTDCENFENEI